MIVAVIGSRSFDNKEMLEKVLDQESIVEVVSGGAKGADTLAAEYAVKNNITLTEILADWSDVSKPDSIIKYHKDGTPYDAYAGIRRNQNIIDKAEMVIAFWDEKSKGTLDALNKAKKAKKKIKIVKYKLIELQGYEKATEEVH